MEKYCDNKWETKQEPSFTPTADNKYMLSTETGKDNTDSLLIKEINAERLVLLAEKDKRRLVLTPVK